jgi:hypothetical protein
VRGFAAAGCSGACAETETAARDKIARTGRKRAVARVKGNSS